MSNYDRYVLNCFAVYFEQSYHEIFLTKFEINSIEKIGL